MAWLNTPITYGRLPKILHWIIVVLLTLMLIGGMTMTDETQRPHEVIGKIILVLAAVRLILRLIRPAPKPNPTHAKWEIGLSHAVHWSFYLILFLYPISGWIMVSAWDYALTGGLPGVPGGWGEAAYSIHEGLKFALLALIALHVAGALKHAVIDRDGTLRRMLFGKSP